MLNHVVIIGRLTRDPELRRTGNGTPVTGFTVAVDRDFSPKGEEKETDFIDCVAWRNTAEFVSKYFAKGRMIVVSGRLTQRKFTDKDGNKRQVHEIVADNCYFGDSKKDDSSGGYGYNAPSGGYDSYGSASSAAPAGDFAVLDDDDGQLPF